MNGLRSTRLSVAVAALATVALWLVPAAAQASFGFLPGAAGFQVTANAEGGGVDTVAGSHPYSLTTEVNFNLAGKYSDGDLKNLTLDLPPGLIENPTAVPKCSAADFSTPRVSPFETSLSGESCPALTQIGIVTLKSSHGTGETRTFGVFNLTAPPGFPSRFGFAPYGEPITFTPHVREAGGVYGITVDLSSFSQQLDVTGFRMVLWGNPWGIAHNDQRVNCLNEVDPSFGHSKCPVLALEPPHEPEAYLTLPTSCEGPLSFHATAESWNQGEALAEATWTGTEAEAMSECETVSFTPSPSGLLSSDRASSPTGYEFTLDNNVQPLLNPRARATSQVKKAVLSLPEGMSVNPSVASGLGVCSEAQFAAETVTSPPGAGCPNVSKVGEITVESPLVEGQIEGSMFFATPRENRFGTLLALYLVAKSPERGIMIKVAGRVDSDPATGRLTAVFDNLPQLPYSHFNVQFREGQRSPLATPSACGNYVSNFDSVPWRDPNIVQHQISPFTLSAGVGGGPCPQGLAPFHPGATAGTLNSNAGSYSPFYLHLTRNDAEQEITSYSASLPPGLLGKIAGIPFCPEADIEAAKRQDGAESATNPACPVASLIGHTYSGYGVGSTLSYAPGTLYLAGPYHGSPISIVAIDSAKVGPFDLGTVVIRSAIRINHATAQVSIDSAGSDPIPHILDGFPLRLRDIRIYIDRPGFMLNPTSCNPFSVTSTLTGAGARFSDPSDDFERRRHLALPGEELLRSGLPAPLRTHPQGRPQARRSPDPEGGAHPGLGRNEPGQSHGHHAAEDLPRPGKHRNHLHPEAVRRPRLPQRLGLRHRDGDHAAALEQSLSGPVYLRSNGSARALPDLVAALSGRGGIEIEALGKIDSRLGGLRARFESLPDAPVTKFTMTSARRRTGNDRQRHQRLHQPAGGDGEVRRSGQRDSGTANSTERDDLRRQKGRCQESQGRQVMSARSGSHPSRGRRAIRGALLTGLLVLAMSGSGAGGRSAQPPVHQDPDQRPGGRTQTPAPGARFPLWSRGQPRRQRPRLRVLQSKNIPYLTARILTARFLPEQRSLRTGE